MVLQSLGRAAGLAFVVLLTRSLDGAEVGRYSTAAAIVLFANLLADFGTTPAITRLVSRERDEANRLLSGTLLSSLLFGTVVAAGVAVFGVAVYDGTTAVDVALASIAIPGASVLSSMLAALDGAGLITRRALVTGLQTLVVASGVVPVLFGAGIRAPIVALGVAPWVGLLVATTLARRALPWESRPRVDLAETRRLLRVALPFAVSGGVTAFVLRFDVILLSLVGTPAETASYDMALRLLEATTYLGAAVGAPLLFVLSRRLGQGDRAGAERAYGDAIRLLYVVGLPVSASLALLARPLVATALGADFAAAATPLAILGGAQWLTFVIVVQGALVMGGDVVGKGIGVGVLNAAVTVVLDLVLVPRYGAVGAAAAMVGSWVFAVAALDLFHRRTVGFSTPLPSVQLLSATGAMAAALFVLRGAPLAVSAGAGALVYGGAVFGLGALGPADFARLRQLLSARTN
jgi:O-antigen/teichoic acid export membrane protein